MSCIYPISIFELNGLGMVDQSLGYPNLLIYQASIIFLWKYLKILVYENPPDSDEDPVIAQISAACLLEIPDIFERANQSLHRHCQA